MLLIAAFCHLVAAVTFVLQIDYVPCICVERSNALSVSRVGFTPSYDLSVARVGSSPSYALSVSRYGSTPSYELSTAHYGSTPFQPFITDPWDGVLGNEAGWCMPAFQPSFILPTLLGPCIAASLARFVYKFASRCLGFVFALCVAIPHWVCAVIIAGLRALLSGFRALLSGLRTLLSGLRALLALGLCAIVVFGCPALVLLGAFLFLFAFVSQLAFVIFAFILFNCFCACLFVGHLGSSIFFKVGPKVSAFLGVCLWICCGFVSLVLTVSFAATYYLYCDHVTGSMADRGFFTEQVSFAMVSFNRGTESILRAVWEPAFSLAVFLLSFFSRLLISLFFFLFVRFFFSSPCPTFF